MRKILLIEDEKIFADPLIITAKDNHLDVHWEDTGVTGLNYLSNHHKNIDLLLLDMNLPDMTGTDIQKEVSRKYPQIPILIITSHKLTEIDHIVGLTLGAEDYYDKTKGFHILLIKIKKILERKLEIPPRDESLSYSKETEQFSFNGKILNLKGAGNNILLNLFNNPNHILPDEKLKQDADLAPTAEIRGYIKTIRASLKNAGLDNPKSFIKTVVGRGYRYSP
jgi:DNA-binding response OmpR family regulator